MSSSSECCSKDGGCCATPTNSPLMPPPLGGARASKPCDQGKLFGDIGKSAADLLSKDFGIVGKANVELKSRTYLGLLTATGSHAPLASSCCAGASPLASVQAEVSPMHGLLAKCKADASGVVNASFEAKLGAALTCTLSGSTPPSGAGGCPIASAVIGAEYSTRALGAQVSYDRIKNRASGSLVATYARATAGVVGAYDPSSASFAAPSFKASYASPSRYTLVGSCAKGEQGQLRYGFSLFHAVSPAMQVATAVQLEGGKVGVSSALSVALDATLSAKARLGSDSTLALACTKKLGPASSVTLAGCSDLGLEPSKTKLGISLAIAP